MIVAGFGFRSGATTASLHAALEEATDVLAVTHLASLEDKVDRLAELAELFALPLIAVCPARIRGESTLTHSRASVIARGIGSVAEACALAGVGGPAQLLVPRCISPDRMATCAIASPLISGAST